LKCGLLERLMHPCHAGGMRKAAKKKAHTKAESKRSPGPDVNELAQYLVRKSTEEKGPIEVQPPTQADISRVMAELGRRGGRIGGKKRAASMTPERRKEIALKAARSRWDS
jgi:hypothetical protein